ncbi:ChbG/HpnK family deacetylase [Chryseobacterium suipulveris]|uniref:ChbG/HpnK family deacetylase n=1 Tax=Chryseobacterium suipulveris TaxID=2929800 RepID=A0ABY4BQB2_9FLAO|nr:ChbG/HpnK family deacetylase [Chryseobacterium suipulveris]UOE41367.1 ChbG/HpnK family deacetylase [Chryseobacterium suipulveris]
MKKLIINADDFGFTLGANQAIFKAHTEGYLTHASLMANTEYFEDAVSLLPQCHGLKIGVHVTLTCGKSLAKESVLEKNDNLDYTFVQLLLMRKSASVLKSIENEVEAQILKIKEQGIEISHIDGHEHIHIIPSINKIVRRLAKKYQIERVREINENFFESLRFNRKNTTVANIIKLLLLKTLSLFNEKSSSVGFYSMLNTCNITAENLFPFLDKSKRYNTVEVMLHPSIIGADSNEYLQTLAPRFRTFINDETRTEEFELCFNKEFENYLKLV